MSKEYHAPSKPPVAPTFEDRPATQLRDGIYSLVFLAVMALIIYGIWSFFDPKAWYVVRYGLSEDISRANIVVPSKPHDCDFGAAPLGSKNCHYESDVQIEKPTFYRRKSDNHLLASYDGGITMFEVTPEEAKKISNTLNVVWRKIQD